MFHIFTFNYYYYHYYHQLSTYINIILCFKFVCFVFKVEWMKPLKQRKIQAKCDVGTFPDGCCKITCKVINKKDIIEMHKLFHTLVNIYIADQIFFWFKNFHTSLIFIFPLIQIMVMNTVQRKIQMKLQSWTKLVKKTKHGQHKNTSLLFPPSEF